MTRTSIQVLIVYTSLSLISAMPFLDTDDGLEKVHDPDDYDMPSRSGAISDIQSKLENIDMDMLTTEALLDILAQYKEMKAMQQEEDANSVSTAKRFELHHGPSSIVRQFRSDGVRRLFPARVFVASRGKRQRYDTASSLYDDLGLPEVKRRRGFTALRGR